MKRYVTKAYIADDCAFDERHSAPTITVLDTDDKHDTGLLDADGNRIYRARERMGFVRCP